MFKKLVHVENLTVANGASGNTVRFTPEAGLITHVAIFYPTIPNPGIVSAKITNDQGEDYAPMQDIRNYRDREAGFYEGKMPVYVEAKGQTFVLTLAATAAFTAAFPVQLVCTYQLDYSQPTC